MENISPIVRHIINELYPDKRERLQRLRLLERLEGIEGIGVEEVQRMEGVMDRIRQWVESKDRGDVFSPERIEDVRVGLRYYWYLYWNGGDRLDTVREHIMNLLKIYKVEEERPDKTDCTFKHLKDMAVRLVETLEYLLPRI